MWHQHYISYSAHVHHHNECGSLMCCNDTVEHRGISYIISLLVLMVNIILKVDLEMCNVAVILL